MKTSHNPAIELADLTAIRTRGGKRIGAGRKPGIHGKKIDKNIALTADVWAFHSDGEGSAGESIETRTRKSAAFKTWLKEQRGT